MEGLHDGKTFGLAPLFGLWKKGHPQMRRLGLARYFIVSFLFLCMGGTVAKIVLRLVFNVKYVWVWPNVFNI